MTTLLAPTVWASRALGTYVHLQVDQPERLAEAGRLTTAVLAEVDLACSRFRGDSDLARANRDAGRWIEVSPILVAALRVALRAARETDGLVDPCLGGLLVTAGYDRTFDELNPLSRAVPDAAQLPRLTGHDRQAWRAVELTDSAVRVPVGAALDLGATGKGFAADLVALAVVESIGGCGVVSVGGDLRAVGSGSWVAEIAPDQAWLAEHGPVCRVHLQDAALAVSSVTARRWSHGGRGWHHVFDPRTGAPAVGPWQAVAAYEASAGAANALTTAALVLGADAPTWLAARGAAALLIGVDGTIQRTPRWHEIVEEVE